MKQEAMTVEKTIEMIHAEFDGASDKILQDAELIISAGISVEKEHRLSQLGFARSKQATAYDKATKDRRLVLHYQQTYPFHRFVSEAIVEQICEKYGLVLGSVSKYIGDVPEKNLCEIEKFKVKVEDYRKPLAWGATIDWGTIVPQQRVVENRFDGIGYTWFDSDAYIKSDLGHAMKIGLCNEYRKNNPEQVKPEFSICAPETDFNTQDMKKEGHKLVPKDPIVLCPVIGGWLVVSKWGLEASDEALLNEKLN